MNEEIKRKANAVVDTFRTAVIEEEYKLIHRAIISTKNTISVLEEGIKESKEPSQITLNCLLLEQKQILTELQSRI